MARIAFRVRSVLRVVGVSLVLVATICIVAKLAFPPIQLGFLWKACLAPPAVYALLGGHLLLHWWLPGSVLINEKRIVHFWGESPWHAKLKEIESSKLIIFSPNHLLLVLRVRGKLHKVGAPGTIDLDLLVALLDKTVVFDKRR